MYCKEIRPFWLIVTKGYGFTAKGIDNSCPSDLQPYADAYAMEQRNRDAEMWSVCGNYVLPAVRVAVERCLYGKKSQSKYPDTSIIEQIKPSEENIERQREAFVMKMRTMKVNWDVAHGKDKERK